MIVAACEIDMRLTNHAHSLKEKRSVIRSLKDKIRHTFKVSVAEVGSQDLRQRCSIGVACVSEKHQEAEATIDKIIHFVERFHDVEIITSNIYVY